MANIRPKDLPRVVVPTAGDTLALDGATTRSITLDNLLAGASDGTVTVPAFSFVSENNSGLYRVSAKLLGFAAGGVNVLQVDGSTASAATGLSIKSAAAGAGLALSVLSSGANDNLTIDAKGSGTIAIGSVSTGAISLGRNTSVAGTLTGTSAGANALAVGPNGATNPALQVDASTASSATGLKIKSAAAAAGLALSVISSGANDNLTIDAKGSGTIAIGSVSTGAISLGRDTSVTSAGANALAVGPNGSTNPALQVDASTASSATGLKIKSAAAAAGLALSVISSGANDNLTIDAKGSGTIAIGSVSTGNVTITPALVAASSVKSTSATAGIGYATGAGNTTTQVTSKSTSCTVNAVCGQITMNNAALGAATSVQFTLNNTTIAATDVVVVNIVGGFATGATYQINAEGNAAGSVKFHLRNTSAGSLSEGLVLQFAVIKAVLS